MTFSAEKQKDILSDLLNCRRRDLPFPAGIEATWLEEGVLKLIPRQARAALVLCQRVSTATRPRPSRYWRRCWFH